MPSPKANPAPSMMMLTHFGGARIWISPRVVMSIVSSQALEQHDSQTRAAVVVSLELAYHVREEAAVVAEEMARALSQ